MSKKSKIVSIKRFKATAGLPDDLVIDKQSDSELRLLHKCEKGVFQKLQGRVKTERWLRKLEANTSRWTEQELFKEGLKRRCEVFAAWQYEAFLGASNTQPKYYVLQEEGQPDSVATKLAVGYKSFNTILKSTPATKHASTLATILSEQTNLKLFSEMLVNFIWLAGSDFKLDHLGVNQQGQLVCIDFEESLVPYRFLDSAYESKGWNFSITSTDLLNAPFFKIYKSDQFFIDKAATRYPTAFDSLKDNPQFKNQWCKAILKRILFPEFIGLAALELFDEYEGQDQQRLRDFIEQRTNELRNAALKNEMFLMFLNAQGDAAFEEIKTEMMTGNLQHTRYFRKESATFINQCQQELDSNYNDILKFVTVSSATNSILAKTGVPSVKVNASADEKRNSLLLFAIQHPLLMAGIVGILNSRKNYT